MQGGLVRIKLYIRLAVKRVQVKILQKVLGGRPFLTRLLSPNHPEWIRTEPGQAHAKVLSSE